jgi:hypothetical protein
MRHSVLTFLLLAVLAGCTHPDINFGQPKQTQIPDGAGQLHTYTYVAITTGNTLFDHTMGFSLFDQDAKHVLTNVTPNSGLLETLGEAAMQGAVPAASLFGPLLK